MNDIHGLLKSCTYSDRLSQENVEMNFICIYTFTLKYIFKLLNWFKLTVGMYL
jgi:uncharacterized lipoprotein YehR (DUF1307 family)